MSGIDYHRLKSRGCCLICPDAEPGCLCYDCMCTKCYHYYIGEDRNGICALAQKFKRENKERFAEFNKKSCIDYTRIGLHKEQTTL